MEPHTKSGQQVGNDNVCAPIPVSKYSNRVELRTLLDRADGGSGLTGERVVIGGWVKSSRAVKKELPPSRHEPHTPAQASVNCTEIIQSRISIFKKLFEALSGGGGRISYEKPEATAQKAVQLPSYMLYFLISDGSCVSSLQVVVDSDLSSLPANQLMPLGTCIVAQGVLRHPTGAVGKHGIELKAEKLLHIGTVDPENYPLSKKQLPLHMLRDYSHFRPRTTTVASMTRIHSGLAFASHTFFQYHGFQYVQTPIITTTDAEGFSEMFRVTTLLGKSGKIDPKTVKEGLSLDTVKAAVKEKASRVEELKRSESNREALVAAVQDLKKTSDLASQLEAKQKSRTGTLVKTEKVNVSEDFFACETFLTISGRLHLASYACALGNVYSFGPRFRAAKIDSARHVAEMWNVETEMAFSELDDAMTCADDFFKFLCKYILDHRSEDMKFMSKRVDKTIIDRLEAITSNPIAKYSYSEVMNLLQNVTDKKFETKPEFDSALTTEHLSYLTDQVYKGPVIIYNYPKAVKPFYARVNDDGKTVAAFDLVVPKVGILISGSQNEERLDKLDARIKESGLLEEQYEWYLDLHRHGAAKHSGFSLRLDLMVQFATSLPDVRDTTPFPRILGKANN